MRQAFQIRLSQLEKRYQRQLMIQQQQSSSCVESLLPINVQLRARQKRANARHRRSSWHSCVSDSETEENPDPIPRCGSSQGFDSDASVDDSDVELSPNDQSAESVPCTSRDLGTGKGETYSRRSHQQESPSQSHTSHCMNGTRTWNEEEGNGARANPSLPTILPQIPIADGSLSPVTKSVIRQRMEEQRANILKYFQQASEAKIAAIEHQYEVHMNAVEKQYQSEAVQQLSVLETRVKDLEKMLDVETLV